MIDRQPISYKDVFNGPLLQEANSRVCLVADFPLLKFDLFAALYATIDTIEDGPFIVGETVTGGTSSATGRIASITDTNITLEDVVGTFTEDETITGGDSGATATISDIGVPNFTIFAFISNQDITNPPDPSLPASPSNEYEQVMYSDETGGVNYNTENPYNPNTDDAPYTPKSFKLLPNGATFFFIRVATYTSGALEKANINLYSTN